MGELAFRRRAAPPARAVSETLDLVGLDRLLRRQDPALATAVQRALTADMAGALEEAPWPDPIPLGPPAPDPLPLDALAPTLRRHVESVAGATQTPPGLGALLGLAAISAAVAGKAVLTADRRRGWTEPAGIYAAAILPPGSRKSPVYDRYERPIREWEAEVQREAGPRRRAALDRVEVLEGRHRKAVSAAASAGDGEALYEVEDARRQLEAARVEVPRLPRLLAADATPEALVRLMAEQGGRIALLSPEGDPFRIADGRYSRGGEARLDELKRAWSGEAIRVDRVGREPVHVPRPALVLAVTMQPSVLETLANARSFRGEGVLARVLWAMPDAGLGSRLTGRDVPALDREAELRYGDVLRRLLEAPAAGEDEDGHLLPHELAPSADSADVLYGYEAEIERAIGPGGRLSGIPDWAAKAAGQAVRLALLLELWARAEDGRPLWSEPVGPWAMEAGVRLLRALTSHALRVFDATEADPDLALARYVFGRLQDLGEPTVKDLYEAVRGKRAISCVADLEAVLRTLEVHKLVRREERASDGPGRPPSPRLRLHPQLREDPATDIRNIRTNPAVGTGGALSADIADANPGSGLESGPDAYEAIEREAIADEELPAGAPAGLGPGDPEGEHPPIPEDR